LGGVSSLVITKSDDVNAWERRLILIISNENAWWAKTQPAEVAS
jgi:hypothetical protein